MDCLLLASSSSSSRRSGWSKEDLVQMLSGGTLVYVCVCVRACVCACVRACVRTCVHACVRRACVRGRVPVTYFVLPFPFPIFFAN